MREREGERTSGSAEERHVMGRKIAAAKNRHSNMSLERCQCHPDRWNVRGNGLWSPGSSSPYSPHPPSDFLFPFRAIISFLIVWGRKCNVVDSFPFGGKNIPSSFYFQIRLGFQKRRRQSHVTRTLTASCFGRESLFSFQLISRTRFIVPLRFFSPFDS